MKANEKPNFKNKSETNLSKIDENSNELDNIDIEFVYKEGGWGWIVVLACGYCFGLIIGMTNNYALLYNEFDRIYNQTENHIVFSGNFFIKNTRKLCKEILNKLFILSLDRKLCTRFTIFSLSRSQRSN